MARSKQPEFEITVDGEPYVWRLRRLPAWSSDAGAFRGMALAIRHAEGQREAVVELPAGPQPKYGAPTLKPAMIAPELVARAVTSTLSVGRERHSWGKTVTIEVDATGA